MNEEKIKLLNKKYMELAVSGQMKSVTELGILMEADEFPEELQGIVINGFINYLRAK